MMLRPLLSTYNCVVMESIFTKNETYLECVSEITHSGKPTF